MLGSKLALRLAAAGPNVYAPGSAAARSLSLRLRLGPTTPTASNLVAAPRRSYAAKSAVDEPVKTVKRAVKKATAKSTSTDGKATKPKTTKKKAPAPPLTEEQKQERKEKAALKAKKAEIADLKQRALLAPKEFRNVGHVNVWIMYATEAAKKAAEAGTSGPDLFSVEVARQRLLGYKALSPAELEHYKQLADKHNEEKRQQYDAWLRSHSADEIRVANQARKKLRSKLDSKQAKKYSPLVDERVVKRVAPPYMLFVREQYATRNLKDQGTSTVEISRKLGEEWKALSDGEKQKYYDMHRKELERYKREYEEVYGHAPS